MYTIIANYQKSVNLGQFYDISTVIEIFQGKRALI